MPTVCPIERIMEITPKSRRLLRLQSLLFVALFLGVLGTLAWLSTRYSFQADWTASGRNTLSEDSRRLLQEMSDPVEVTAFARDNELLRKQIQDLVARYQRAKPDLALRFVNPDTQPERVREMGITVDGELLLSYQGRSEKVQQLSEQHLTNALQRIARQGERWIVFLSGHGERDPGGQANHDLGAFGRELERKGLKVQTVNLAQTPAIPDNASLLVIASPQAKLLPGEVKLIRDYMNAGGNLLWFTEPEGARGLEPVAEDLGIEFLPGKIVDATTQLFGINNPAFVLVPEYAVHPVTRDLYSLTLFPETVALEARTEEPWVASPLLTTLERTWTEIGELDGTIQYDSDTDERPGPLDLAFVLTRSRESGQMEGTETSEQRVIVVGDGDFLSNAFLGNGVNLDLGLNMIHWLSHDEQFIAIRAKSAPDTRLELGRTAQGVIAFGFLFIVPGLLLLSGLVIWLRRRGR
jgi:ABC-type uncharacterized transport system involved in gliding motility auxiliary subunit